jgi:hypothetical protein
MNRRGKLGEKAGTRKGHSRAGKAYRGAWWGMGCPSKRRDHRKTEAVAPPKSKQMVNAGVGFASSQKGRCGFLQFVKFGSAHLANSKIRIE